MLLASASLHASQITSYSGNFSADDNVVFFDFALANTSSILIQTTSFAASAGFEPVLTVFDATGNLLFQDATGGTAPSGCGVRSIDPVSHYCLDAVIQNVLTTGDYVLALSEYDNIPGGPTLADGFSQAGNGNFTGPEFAGSPGSFILFDGSQRTGAYALSIDIANNPVTPPPVTVTPEPAALELTFTGLLAVFYAARRRFIPARNLKQN